MDEQPPNYHREFLASPQHATLGILTLGAGFMSGMLLPLIAGATIYTLGWIYMPDLPFFRHWVDRRREASKKEEELRKVSEFGLRRQSLVSSLTSERRARYTALAQVCRDIETASADNLLASADASTDPRLRKLDELMWTFLRLLGIEDSLERFLETERSENIPTLLKDAENEVARLKEEVEKLLAKGASSALDGRKRYLDSRLERLEVLRKREQRLQEAEQNLSLVSSEQDRLEQQVKLIRADAVATKNAETLTARIDATIEHLDQTNKWLSELDQFKDLVGDMPSTELRVGYEASVGPKPPPIIEPMQGRKREAIRQK
jgi:hypothetical protein